LDSSITFLFSVNLFFSAPLFFCSYIIDCFVQLKHSVHTRVQESLFKMDDIFQFVCSKARGMSAEVKTMQHQPAPLIFSSTFFLCAADGLCRSFYMFL
jgi:hypothetical protein